MADYGFNTQLTPQTQQSNLGDMVNLARGIQAYQQTQQLNPLQIQQQQQLAQKGALEIQNLQRANDERVKVESFLAEPSNYTNEDGMIDMVRANKEIRKLAPITGADYLKPMGELATNQLAISQAKQNLTQSGKSIVANALGPIAYAGETDPNVYIKALNNVIKIDPSLTKIAGAYQNMLSSLKPGQHIPRDILREVQGMQPASEQFTELAKKPTTISLGGSVQPATITPSVAGEEPSIKPSGAGMDVTMTPGFTVINGITYVADKFGSLHPAGSTAATKIIEESKSSKTQPASQSAPQTVPQTKLFKEDMPVPQGGLRQMNEQQKARYDAGQKLFSEASDINQKAADQKTILDSIRQNLSQAQSSRPGQLLRQGSKFVQGSEQLDSLLKDLAANQIAQSKVMGADTDAARQTNAIATGSADIDPKALQKIIERADATRLATQMYNQGLSAYKRRDPLNSAIHADRFQQAWQDNYDPRIFMVENINNSNMSQDQKQKAIRNIVGIATPKELADLKQKATNIRRLQTGDF